MLTLDNRPDHGLLPWTVVLLNPDLLHVQACGWETETEGNLGTGSFVSSTNSFKHFTGKFYFKSSISCDPL